MGKLIDLPFIFFHQKVSKRQRFRNNKKVIWKNTARVFTWILPSSVILSFQIYFCQLSSHSFFAYEYSNYFIPMVGRCTKIRLIHHTCSQRPCIWTGIRFLLIWLSSQLTCKVFVEALEWRAKLLSVGNCCDAGSPAALLNLGD